MAKEIKVFDIWSKQEALAEEVYSRANYKIVENPDAKREECILYFSSNNVWFPNTEEAFRYSFVENDYYEWMKYGKVSRKAIFFRDIYKSWYVTGVNQELSTVDKLVDFIREETKGMEIITVGSSAGGYMAALMGALLGAKYVLCFSAQFDLYTNGGVGANPYLKKYESDDARNRYFNIVEIIRSSNVPVFYLLPALAPMDIFQMNQIKDCKNCHILRMKSKHHGVSVLKGNIWELLHLDIKELKALFNRNKDRLVGACQLSLQLCGIGRTMVYWKDEGLRMVRKKLRGR